MREYELTYIIKPDIDAAAVAVVIEKINGFIAAENGTLVKTDVWGMRKLTYAIRRYREGQYFFNIIKLPEDAPARLENRIKLTEDVIRHMLVIADPSKMPASTAAMFFCRGGTSALAGVSLIRMKSRKPKKMKRLNHGSMMPLRK